MQPVYIGTSGWHYKHWIGRFYPERIRPPEMLRYYARHFDTVELDSTFYRLPSEDAVDNWRDTNPPDFLFAAKASRFLTHMKKLTDTNRGLDRFFERVLRLGRKLGPVLFQLPPFWNVNLERLENFLEALPKGHRYAFEFRNRTWDCNEVLKLLRRRRAAYCIYHLAGFETPLHITTDFTYVRLHGPAGPYGGSYPDSELRSWARRIRQWGLRRAYIYFDNDQEGFAASNALTLKKMLHQCAE